MLPREGTSSILPPARRSALTPPRVIPQEERHAEAGPLPPAEVGTRFTDRGWPPRG